MKFLVQILGKEPVAMRKKWRKVEAGSFGDAIWKVLRKKSKAVPRMKRMCGGNLYVVVASVTIDGEKNVRDNGMPVVVHGYNVELKNTAA